MSSDYEDSDFDDGFEEDTLEDEGDDSYDAVSIASK
jgi:hypothetical protein